MDRDISGMDKASHRQRGKQEANGLITQITPHTSDSEPNTARRTQGGRSWLLST